MKNYLSNIVKEHGYKTVKEFLTEYYVAKAENAAYKKAIVDWEKEYGTRAEPDSIKARLKNHQRQVKKNENNKHCTYYYSVDSGAR